MAGDRADETKPCPKCGSKMIVRFENREYPTNPPKRPWYWWCGCGHREVGGVQTRKTEEQIARERWERAQGDEGG